MQDIKFKDFKKLNDYASYYVYNFECESIHISPGPLHNEAKMFYSHIVRDFFLQDDYKWALDIALDCIRQFNDEEKNTIIKLNEIPEYHMNFGLWVRNHYIHPSLFHLCLCADRVSSKVEKFIYLILLPKYDQLPQ